MDQFEELLPEEELLEEEGLNDALHEAAESPTGDEDDDADLL